MDMKIRIQYKIQELKQSNKFLLNNNRYVKFIDDLFLLVDKNGRIPLPSILAIKLRIKISKIYYMIEALQKHGAWPFLGSRSKYSPVSYQPNVKFASKDMLNVAHELSPVEESIDDDINKRLEAARKAKRAKWGDTLKDEDIEAYL